jgi:hypothetical protein
MSALTAAWQAALAAEHQAAFGYPVLGPRLDGADHQLAYADAVAHEALRDTTAAALSAARQTPVAPLADYPALYPVSDATAARRLAVQLEDDCAEAWRYLYLQAASASGATARRLRGTAQAGLIASAVRAAQWRARIDPRQATQPFPGTRQR